MDESFTRGTSHDYEIQGQVSWLEDQVLLSPGSSLTRSLNGGPWAEVDIEIEWPDTTEAEPPGELQIWFLLDDATDCYVRLRLAGQRGRRDGTVAVVDTGEEGGELVVRETGVQQGQLRARRYSFEYRYGLIRVRADGAELLVAALENGPARVRAARIVSVALPVSINRLRASRSRDTTVPQGDLTEQQQQQLAIIQDRLQSAYDQGELAGAISKADEELDFIVSALGKQHPQVADRLLTLYLLHDEAGDRTRALDFCGRAAELNKVALGEYHPSFVHSLDSLMLTYMDSGDYRRAESLCSEVLRVQKLVFGADHPDCSHRLSILANLVVDRGDYGRAERLYRQALAGFKTTHGDDHPEYATALSNLALLYRAQGQFAQALTLLEQSADIVRNALGEDDPEFAYKLNNLAELLTTMGRYDRAEAMYRKAIPIIKASDGEQSAEYATLLNNLAIVLDNRGDVRQALSLFQKSTEIRRAVLGRDHPDYATSLANLAGMYEDLSDLVHATPLYREAMEIRQRVLGEQHPDYADSLYDLASLLTSKGEYSQAQVLYERVLQLRRSLFPDEHPSVITTLHGLAVFYRSKGEYARAEELFQRVIDIKEKVFGAAHPSYAMSLSQMALLYGRMEQFQRAEQLYVRARDINQSALGKDHPSFAKCNNDLGLLYVRMGRYAAAEELYQEAISIWESLPNAGCRDHMASLSNIGHLYQLMGDYLRAEQLYRQCLETSRSRFGEQNADYATHLTNLSNLYDSMGEFSQAEELGLRAAGIWEATLGKQHVNYAASLNNLASLYRDMGDYARAELLFLQSMEIRKAMLGDLHSEYAASLNNLASVYRSKGDYATAERRYRQALEIFRASLGEQHVAYASSLNNLAIMYFDMGDYVRAERGYLEAMEIRGKTLGERHPEYAASLNNLGLLYHRLGDLDRAIEFCEQALQIRKAVLGPNHQDSAASMNNLAPLYEATGRQEQAKQMYEAALKIWFEVLGEEHPSTATGLNNLGLLCSKSGEHEQARSYLERSMAIRRRVLGENHPTYADSLNNLAEWHRGQSNYSEAESLARQATMIARRQLDITSVVQAERQQKAMQAAKRYFLDNYLSSAIAASADAKTIVDIVWQWKGMVSLRQSVYRQLAARPALTPLFEKLQSVSHQLSTHLGRVPAPPPTSDGESVQRSYLATKKLWQVRFDALVRQREELERDIAAQSAAYKLVQQPLTVEEVQNLLGPDAAFVDFLDFNQTVLDASATGGVRSERHYLAVVIRKDQGPRVITLAAARLVAQRIAEFRQPLCGDADLAAIQRATDAAAELRGHLWNPLEQHLSGIKTVIISPDTVLGTLPLAALPGRQKGTYLIEDYRIATLPMARLLQSLYLADAREHGQQGLLVLGDVDYDAGAGAFDEQSALVQHQVPKSLATVNGSGSPLLTRGSGASRQWTTLPGFREELEIVTALHRQRFEDDLEIFTLTGPGATEQSFLQHAPHFSTLHIITHGYFESPGAASGGLGESHAATELVPTPESDRVVNTWMPALLCGLVLAGANNAPTSAAVVHDGLLQAAEIEASSLRNVDLVTLSACETGLGVVAEGEGLTGLQRAFHIAGARTVVASLWKVDDQATRELIGRFYTNVWQKNMNKLDALREAQLWMLHHPNELESLGIQSVRTRGRVANLPGVIRQHPLPHDTLRTAPYYWAAFQLSGDWRS